MDHFSGRIAQFSQFRISDLEVKNFQRHVTLQPCQRFQRSCTHFASTFDALSNGTHHYKLRLTVCCTSDMLGRQPISDLQVNLVLATTLSTSLMRPYPLSTRRPSNTNSSIDLPIVRSGSSSLDLDQQALTLFRIGYTSSGIFEVMQPSEHNDNLPFFWSLL